MANYQCFLWHFHARYANHKISINIHTLEVINGKMPAKSNTMYEEFKKHSQWIPTSDAFPPS